jgi:glycosyltransferase involved in cell wall biosynthesis
MKRLRAIFLNGSAQPGGGEIALAELVEAVPDAKVILFDSGPAEELFRVKGVQVEVHPLSKGIRENSKESGLPGPRTILSALVQAWKLSKKLRDCQVVHCNNQKAWVIGAIASRIASRPVVWHLHDILSAEHFSRSKIRLVVGLANWRASRVVANSHASARAFIEAGGRSDLVEVVYNPVSPERFVNALPIEGFREEIGCPDGEPVFGVFSRLAGWKGQHVAIEALSRLKTGHLVLVGAPLFSEEAYEAELRALVGKLGLEKRVHFLGFRKDIPRLLASIDVALHTSIVAEPFGLVILEAQLAGKPVIATAAGGALEIIENGINGWLVAPGDSSALAEAMAVGLEPRQNLVAFGLKARAFAMEKFGADALRTRFRTLLEDAAGL